MKKRLDPFFAYAEKGIFLFFIEKKLIKMDEGVGSNGRTSKTD
ncbi:hypothetical protein C240_1158 [Enterococcus sp. 5H]|nr:hypothetical protein [Enterococcus sp. 5H]